MTSFLASNQTAATGKRLISIVVPVYNEQDNIAEMHRRVAAVFDELSDYNFELIFVDDGSTDDSAGRVRELIAAGENTRLVRLSRNFGHQAALMAGHDHTQGDAVITLDGDLQHPPEIIPTFVEKWESGTRVVVGQRREDRKLGLFKRATSRLFYRLINVIGQVHLTPHSADLRLMDREVVEALRQLRERTPFVRGLVNWIGFTQETVVYNEGVRRHGRPAYSTRGMVRLALSGITSFSAFPLRLSGYLGAVVAGAAFLYGLAALWFRLFTDRTQPGWTSVVIAVLFLGGVQLISIGVLGEYLYRVYDEVKARPTYVVMERSGFESKSVGGEGETA